MPDFDDRGGFVAILAPVDAKSIGLRPGQVQEALPIKA